MILQQIIPLLVIAGVFALVLIIITVVSNHSLNGIKRKKVGDGQHAYFYEAAEGLITSMILAIAEFCPPRERHIISVYKMIQELLSPVDKQGRTPYHKLLELLPPEHKARWFAGSAATSAGMSLSSIMSTALARLNTFLDSEMETILCQNTSIDVERFCKTKSAIYLVLPEEDISRHFLVRACLESFQIIQNVV